MVRIAKYDRVLLVQKKEKLPEGGGSHKPTWVDVKPIRGQKIDVTGVEKFEGDRLTAEAKTIFKIRFKSGRGIDETMRIVFDGYAYPIENISSTGGRQRELTISTKKREKL